MINSGNEPINKNLPIMIPIERKDLDTVITDTLRSYEREVTQMNLIVTSEVIRFMTQLERALSLPSGKVLICGSAGVG